MGILSGLFRSRDKPKTARWAAATDFSTVRAVQANVCQKEVQCR